MFVSKNAKKKLKFASPNTKPQHESVEYKISRLRWVPNTKFCVGHVHLMFFVLISFAFGGQRKPSIQWNMGLREHDINIKKIKEKVKKGEILVL